MLAFGNDIESMPPNCKVFLVIRRGRQVKCFFFSFSLKTIFQGSKNFIGKTTAAASCSGIISCPMEWWVLFSSDLLSFFLSPAFTLDRTYFIIDMGFSFATIAGVGKGAHSVPSC